MIPKILTALKEMQVSSEGRRSSEKIHDGICLADGQLLDTFALYGSGSWILSQRGGIGEDGSVQAPQIMAGENPTNPNLPQGH
jgi:hypothetical protein